MQEIDLKSVFSLLLAKVKWLIIGAAIGILVFGVYAFAFVPEQYTATSYVYVRTTKDDYNSNSDGTTVGNLTAAQQLVANYSIHMKTEPVLQSAVQKLGNKVTTKQLKKSCTAVGLDDTSWLKISVTMDTAELAVDACRALADASAETFVELEASAASVREYPSKATQTAPNITRTAALGALLGIALTVIIILLRQFTDTTIHDKQDLQSHIDVPVLGEIPSFELTSGGKKGGRAHA